MLPRAASTIETLTALMTYVDHTYIRGRDANKILNPTDPVHLPKTYQLVESKSSEPEEKQVPELLFYVLGCAGDGHEGQKKVANLMNKISITQGKKPKFIIFLGDNFYNNGVTSPTDQAFADKFYSVYQRAEYDGIRGIPCFFIAGNHDHRIYKYGGDRGWTIDFKLIESQIKHTFYSEEKEDPEKIKLYNENILDLSALQAWNMPRRFYSLTIDDCEFYFYDTNTYVRDYLASLKNKDHPDQNNQAIWLEHTAKKNAAKKFLFGHHPRYTIGKRFFESDAKLFITDADILELKELGIEGNYNQILNTILEKQGLKFDITFAAHDHSMSYYVSDNLCQVIAGGGGGELQSRENYSQSERMPCYLKENGFTSVTINPNKNTIIDIYSINHHHLQFCQDSNIPLRRESKLEDSLLMEKILPELIKACHAYLNKSGFNIKFFDKTKKLLWRESWVNPEDANQFLNFLNRFEPFTLMDLAKELRPLLAYDNSFDLLMEEAFQSSGCEITLQNFMDQYAGPVSPTTLVNDFL